MRTAVPASARRSPRRGGRSAASPARLTLPTLLTLTAIVTIVPFVAMVLVAFAPPSGETFPTALDPTRWTWQNFSTVLSSSDIPRWTLNSLIYSVGSVVFVLLFASMAGYAFAKKRFPAGR